MQAIIRPSLAQIHQYRFTFTSETLPTSLPEYYQRHNMAMAQTRKLSSFQGGGLRGKTVIINLPPLARRNWLVTHIGGKNLAGREVKNAVNHALWEVLVQPGGPGTHVKVQYAQRFWNSSARPADHPTTRAGARRDNSIPMKEQAIKLQENWRHKAEAATRRLCLQLELAGVESSKDDTIELRKKIYTYMNTKARAAHNGYHWIDNDTGYPLPYVNFLPGTTARSSI
ncbi:uncharacterized protein PAC_05124 [Phialocephala subalpina]|uniref:Uncharacterized protein n=1 Tax=Phialocephala subalpina TaxID=576137 RepID=A0A1L7WR30_9HELO|nr:uncharacterized protein PAC_05124 [Phialocephala subalpina]